MAEVLVEFEGTITGPDKLQYEAQACGRPRADGLWEGWIEFVGVGAGTNVRTGRETTQPNRDDLMYWATGLTAAYLEGALLRTSRVLPRLPAREKITSKPYYDGPSEV